MDSAQAEKIAQLVTRWIAQDPAMKEANVKLRIIQPLLEALGWDPGTGDLEMEYPVQVGARPFAVDYALMVNGKAAVYVEAKSFASGLPEEDIRQVISYGSVDHLRWCVLTNGRELQILDSSEPKESPERLVTTIRLQDLPIQLAEIHLISRESVVSQETEKMVIERKTMRSATKRLEESQESIAKSIAEVIRPILPDLRPGDIEKLANKGVGAILESVRQTQSTRSKPLAPQAPKPAATHRGVPKAELPVVARRQLPGSPNDLILISPAKVIRGLDFLFKYQAWGFVRVNGQPKHFALYVGKPDSKILYVGEVERLTPPLATKTDVVGIEEQDLESFEPGKRVVWLKAGSLRKLSDPIVVEGSASAPYSSRYTTFREFVAAKTTADLWGKSSKG